MHYVWAMIAQQSQDPWLVRNAPVLSALVASASALFAWRSSRAAAQSAELAAERDHRERTPQFELIDDGHHTGTGISRLRLRQVSGPPLREVKFRVNELHERSSPHSQEYHPGKVQLGGEWGIGGNLGPMHLHEEVVLKVRIESRKKEEFALLLYCTSRYDEKWSTRAEIVQ
jgi:hypothetical protein